MWDSVRLAEQPLDSLPRELRDWALEQNLSLNRGSEIIDPHVNLDTGWQEFFASRSKSLRKNFRRKLRKLQSLGNFEMQSVTNPQSNEEPFTRYLEVANKGWKATISTSLESRPETQSFYRDLIASSNGEFDWCFRFLTISDEPIAATFGLLYQGNYSSIEICHNLQYEIFSPGFVLTGLELEDCMRDERFKEFDFLSGTLDNKSSWSTGLRKTRDVYLLPRHLHGRAVSFTMFRLKPALKRLLQGTGLYGLAETALARIKEILKH